MDALALFVHGLAGIACLPVDVTFPCPLLTAARSEVTAPPPASTFDNA
jgi:hypothetical protein